jgi:hypothetical protein
MASQYSLTNGTNGSNGVGTLLARILGDALKVLIPIVMAGYAIYQNNVSGRERDEATRVEVQQLKSDVAYMKEHYVSREEVRDLLEPLRGAGADTRNAIRDIENFLRNQQGRGYGRQQSN